MSESQAAGDAVSAVDPAVYAVPPLNRIAIVEDKAVIRAGLEKLVGGMPGCSCVCACDSAEEALRKLPPLQPDIVIMDIHLPNLSGIECTARLKELLPKVLVLMLTVYEDEEKIFRALKAGASGYLLKRSSPEEITGALQELRRGGAPMTSAIARRVVDSFLARPASSPDETKLSRRELEILHHLSRGDSNKEIASHLSLATATVRWHLKQIYEKLHVHGRTEAAVKFLGVNRKN